MSEIEMTVEEKKQAARVEKITLIQKIVMSSGLYTPELLNGKTLKQLRAIYSKVVH